MGTREIRKEIYADYIRHIEEHNEENRLAAFGDAEALFLQADVGQKRIWINLKLFLFHGISPVSNIA